ncbi:RNA polymerase sigma factor [Streptomyces uncialis]|uniref:RNA polymerase sigma factor n=1 Tax=Streptomyces uncialis TaxID=1048205 RepID=UPI0037AE7B66
MAELPLEFEAFCQTYHRPYLKYALLHLGDRAAAVDTVEVVFAQLLEDWDDVLVMASVHRYAFAVLRHAIAARLALSGRPTAMVEAAVFERVRTVVRRQMEVMESALGLYSAIARLPERQLDVIILLFVLGYGKHQTASIMGISPGTVRSHLHTARRQLARDVGVPWDSSWEAEEIV